MLCLSRDVCGLVWDLPLMSDVVCNVDQCVDELVALLCPSQSARGSIRLSNALTLSSLVYWSFVYELVLVGCVCGV